MEDSASGWHTAFTNVNDRLLFALTSELLTDCTFAVGFVPELIRAHRFILGLASPVFDAMLNGTLAEGNAPIRVPDVEPAVFKNMLKYIYSDVITLESYESVCELYSVAKKYMLGHLEKGCIKYLTSNLTYTNVCQLYEFGGMYQDVKLMDPTLEFICKNTQKIILLDEFKNIRISTLITIFAEEFLNIESEVELFKALESYARTNLLSRSFNTTRSIYDALCHIRFLSLTPEQFAQGPGLSELLTKSEILTILMKLLQPPGNKYDIPEGFSLSTEKRFFVNNPMYATRSDPMTSIYRNVDGKSGKCIFDTLFKVNACIKLLGVELTTQVSDEESYIENVTVKVMNSGHILAIGTAENKLIPAAATTHQILFDEPYCTEKGKMYTVQTTLFKDGSYWVQSNIDNKRDFVKIDSLTFEFFNMRTSFLTSLIFHLEP